MKRIIYILMALVLVLTGCTEETPLPPSIETGGDIILNIGDSVEVGARVLPEGSNQKLLYSLSHESISSVSDYITVDGNGVLHAIKLPGNPVFTLSIVSPEYGISSNVEVVLQYDPKGGIASIDTDSIISSSSDASSHEVHVTRKTEKTSFYEIGNVPEWIEITHVEKGRLVDTYLLKMSENKTLQQRHAEIKFGDKIVSVTQNGAEVELDLPEVIEIQAGTGMKLEARLIPSGEIAVMEWYIPGSEELSAYIEIKEGFLRALKPYTGDKNIVLVGYNRENNIRRDIDVRITVDPDSGIDFLSPSEYRLEESRGGEFSFTVIKKTASTTFYEITGLPAWIEPVSEKSEGRTTLHTFRIAENLSGKERSAEIKVGDHVFKVSQIANAASINPVDRKLVTNLASFTDIHPGTSFDIEARIDSEVESVQDLKYSVEIEGLSTPEVERFISVSSSGYVDVHRIWEGEKKVVLHVESPVYGYNESREVNLKLDPEAGIESVDHVELTLDETGINPVEFNVTRKNDSLFPYEVSSTESWITIVKTGSSSIVDTYSVSATSNPGSADRTASIHIPGFTINVTQKGFVEESTVPSEIIFDGFTPSWDGTNLYIGNEYAISAHVYPFSAPQDLKYSLKSRGTGKGQGAQNKFVYDDSIPSFIELDGENGIIRPFSRGDLYWSPDYYLIISTPDGSVSTKVPFTITFDGKAGINNVHIPGIEGNKVDFETHEKNRTVVEVFKNTALSTVVGFESDSSWLSARKVGEEDGGRIDLWEIGVAPNRIRSGRSGKITFTGNNNTRYTISVDQPGNPDPQRHTEWVYGVKPPEPGEYADDQKIGGDYFEIYERSDIDQGWYLATKSTLSNQGYTIPDANLCWAMSTANLIHWWAEHNGKYIEAFKDLHPGISPAIDITYNKNAEYVKDKSSLIPMFIQRHGDSGGHVNVGLLDMLFRPRNTGNGEVARVLPDGSIIWADRPHQQYPGWFHEVFQGHEHEMVKISYLDSARDLERMFDEAFMFDKGIAISVHYYNIKGGNAYHAINVWGVTYDELGRIVEIVIGDNNLNSQRAGEDALAYLTNYLVSYSSKGIPEIWNPAVVDDPDNRAMGEIYEVVLLDQGTQLWEKWAKENNVVL